MAMTSPDHPTYAFKERSTVFLMLLALLGTLLVIVAPAPTAFAEDQVADGAVEFYVEFVQWDSAAEELVAPLNIQIEHHVLSRGGPINDAMRGDQDGFQGATAVIAGFTVASLHLSCSEDFIDQSVYNADGELLGFESAHSDFEDSWLITPTPDLENTPGAVPQIAGDLDSQLMVPSLAIVNKTTGADRSCGWIPLPDREPEPGTITATKALADGTDWPEDGTFTFVLYDDDGELDTDDATDTNRTVTFSDLDAGTYTVCEEGLDEHWDLIGVSVDGDTVEDDDGCVEVTVGEGETVAVVFTNEFDEPVVPVGIIIELVKTNDADGDGTFTDVETAPEEGADVDFQLLVMNTNGTDVVVDGLTDSYGDITIDLLASTVAPEGAAALSDNTCTALDGVTIPAGESASCTFTLEGYAPAAGTDLTNTARVDVHEDGNTDNTADDSDTSTVDTAVPVVVEANPDISLVKEADVDEAEVGDVITYTYTVTNTGDVTLTDLTLDDDVLGEIELESTTLEPGESTTGTATHTVTEDDLDAGEVHNVAVVTGWPPEGDAVTDDDDATVIIIAQAVFPRIVEPAPKTNETLPAAEETLPKTGADTSALLLWALIALGLGAGALRTAPREGRPTT